MMKKNYAALLMATRLIATRLIATNLIAILITTGFYLPTAFANTDEHSGSHATTHAHDHSENPVVAKVMFNQLELRNAESGNSFNLEAHAWIGKDMNKFWLKTDIEKQNGEIEHAEVQALYSRAITPYWNIQTGIRHDVKPTPTRTWGAFGIQGLAPYFFDVDATFFVRESGNTALRISAEYELLFTQALILSPAVEMNFYGQDDEETGAGLVDITAGLRLRYEIFREFAPYIGVHWSRQFGTTADITTRNGKIPNTTHLVAGVRLWF